MQIIDPHLHLFDLTQGDYHWLTAENPPFWRDKAQINKNFDESFLDLTPLTLAGFVHIEAGFDNQHPWREIDWLERNCRKPFKAVAFIDIQLGDKLFDQQLQQLLTYPSVTGCRYILDQDAAKLLNTPQVQRNLAHLAQYGLSFDAQLPLADHKAVQALIRVITQTPTLKVIINHAGWPPYIEPNLSVSHSGNNLAKDNHPQGINWQSWLAGLSALAAFSQVAIKCSGWEMTERDYNMAWSGQVINKCLTHFGNHRVMLSSNFPLCLFSREYLTLWQSYLQLDIKPHLLELLVSANARHWYQLPLSDNT